MRDNDLTCWKESNSSTFFFLQWTVKLYGKRILNKEFFNLRDTCQIQKLLPTWSFWCYSSHDRSVYLDSIQLDQYVSVVLLLLGGPYKEGNTLQILWEYLLFKQEVLRCKGLTDSHCSPKSKYAIASNRWKQQESCSTQPWKHLHELMNMALMGVQNHIFILKSCTVLYSLVTILPVLLKRNLHINYVCRPNGH